MKMHRIAEVISCNAHRTAQIVFYMRGIGVGVKGVTGRDAIVHKSERNSSQKETQ